jgi:16S rRNA (cytosine967-C5)-methyltransferase
LLDALTREALDRLEAVRAECLSLLKEALAIPLPEADEKVENALSTLFSVPGFWIEEGPWRTAGEAFEELSVGRTPQSVHLRVNVARARREEILEEFYCSASVEARPSGRSPWGIVLPRRIDLRNLRAWREGLLEIQDEGSQLVAALCRPLPDGAKILDFCAGGGGKALALASEVFRQGGRVTAHDADASRLRRTLPRLARSGLSNLNLVEKVKDLRLKSFDLVLVDAPCSSSGTIRRNPEIPWRWTREKIHRLSETQVGVLEKASEFVKPGGKLVYATCSLLRPENEGSIEAFLSRNEEFKLEPFPKPNPVEDLPGVSDGRVRLPLNLSEYDGDSFFVARLARRG